MAGKQPLERGTKGTRQQRQNPTRRPGRPAASTLPVGHESSAERSSLALRQQAVLQMQRTQGNTSTRFYLARKGQPRALQRVQISDPSTSEVLHNRVDPATNQFRPRTYAVGSTSLAGAAGGNTRYEMTRTPGSLLVNVRIKFVTEFANGATAAQPVPEGDARTSAESICTNLATLWNNRFELVGHRPRPTDAGVPIPAGVPEPATVGGPDGGVASSTGTAGPVDAGVPPAAPEQEEIVLPVRFQATPVFDLDAEAHTVVRFDATTVADAQPGRVIDAGHWFANMNPNNYAGTLTDTYAHEYGHLLGIPDEYSLSNPNAHAIMHQFSTNATTQATMDQAMDQGGMREMILAALRPQLQARLAGVGGDVALAVREQRNALRRALSNGLRQAWQEGGVVELIGLLVQADLLAAGQTRAAARVQDALRFQATRNLSNFSIASDAVDVEIQPGALQAIVDTAFTTAADNAARPVITIPYTDDSGSAASVDVRVAVAPSASAATSPLTAAATQAATSAVGTPTPAAGRGRRRVPLYPSNTLMGQLTTMPNRWRNIGEVMESEIGGMSADILGTATTASLATDFSTEVNNNVRQLYRTLFNLVNNVSTTVVRNTIRTFLSSQMAPIIQDQVDDLMGMIENELGMHTTAVGTGTNASPGTPPDPTLLAAVQQLRTNAATMLNPAAPAAGGAAQQHVRFTFNTLMGANSAGTSLRTTQMEQILAHFNNDRELRTEDDPFEIRSRAP